MWHDLWIMSIPAPEKIIRTVVVYAAIAVLLRLAGKRELAQLNSTDLVVVLLLANVVQNAIIGADTSLIGGLIGAVVLVSVNALVVRLTVRLSDRAPRVGHWLEGAPTTLVRNGVIDSRALHRQGLRQGDVIAALRRQGADRVSDVKELILAPGGSLVVRLKPEEESASRTDIDRLEGRLAEIQARLESLTDSKNT